MTRRSTNYRLSRLGNFLTRKYVDEQIRNKSELEQGEILLDYRRQLRQIKDDVGIFNELKRYIKSLRTYTSFISYRDQLLKRENCHPLFKEAVGNLFLQMEQDFVNGEINDASHRLHYNILINQVSLIEINVQEMYDTIKDKLSELNDGIEKTGIQNIKQDEKRRLSKALSILNEDQKIVVTHLWKKYKYLEQFHGTREMESAGMSKYDGFAALFLSTKNPEHKKFYKTAFNSNNDDKRIPKNYYRFSLDFQEQILKL